jgi:hypothetical protein
MTRLARSMHNAPPETPRTGTAMAIDIKEPAVKAPWPPREENDPLYRYPKPCPVGRAKGENFFTIAKKHKIGASDLVTYNFRTKNSGEINWYLANYVGSVRPRNTASDTSNSPARPTTP